MPEPTVKQLLYSQRVLPVLVGALAGLASILIWGMLTVQERRHIQQTFDVQADSMRQQIRGRIEARILPLERMARRWEAYGPPQRELWDFAASLNIEQFAGFKAIEWIDDASYIQWVHPLEGNESLVGERLDTDPLRREALRRARDRRETVHVGGVELIQGGTGLAAYVPIYREAVFEGYIAGIFEVDELFDALFNELENEEPRLQGFSIVIRGGNEELFSRRRPRSASELRWGRDRPFSLAGVDWQLRVWPTRAYLAQIRSVTPEVVLAAGLLMAVILALTTHLAQTARRRALALDASNQYLEKLINELKRAQEALRQEQEFLKALLDNLQEGIIACDDKGNLSLFNRATQLFHGKPLESVPLDQLAEHYDLYEPDGKTPLPREANPLARAFAGESIREAEMLISTRDGHPRLVQASGQPIIDPAGKKLGAVVVLQDITRRRRAERDLQETADRLKQSNRELEDFASVASHDLQEPLRKIQAFGDRIRVKYADSFDDEARDYFERMLSAATRMRTLINDLLTFSRVTTRAQPFTRVDLNRIAQEVLSDLESRIEELDADVEIGELPRLDADPTQMRQLLQNLIGNALKFHRANTTPRVRVYGIIEQQDELIGLTREATSHAFCRLFVEDNGIGFDEKYLDRIFRVFQRLHGRNDFPGSGVGLTICRKIVQRHHGRITARSEPGRGTTFIVTLPLKQRDVALVQESFKEEVNA